ncbi:nibrin [Bactrocera neohumeralis]|uniref:nibrin n=1 Tax=Bactrocera neohumeralis TaxID=98809 RepID=UPI0021662AEA|nr:nibrin [Bactrocera neohumeralis]
MWLLTNVATGNALIVINEKSKYAVGRVGADLVICDDSSISRTHAFLHITQNITMDNEDQKSIELLELEDAGSKYGTFHNDGIEKNVGAPKQKRIPLSEGDRIRFGVLKSIWLVSKITPIVAVSALPVEITKQLQQYIQVLGGSILAGWKDTYTHLTLAEIKLIPKLLHAIIDKKPIVTCDYWCSVVQAARRGRRSLPNAASYIPPNPRNLDLSYREERKSIFKNITFVFLNARHFNIYAPIVEKTGGKSKHLNVGIQKSFLVRKDVVVIQYVPSTESQSSQTVSTIEDYLKQHSRRTVPEYEIGFAIIHCSTQMYCNPSYKEAENLDFESESIESGVLQSSGKQTDCSNPLVGDETEVFIPETDHKSTASTHLTDKSAIELPATGADQTDSVTIESQTFEQKDSLPSDVVMSSLQVTESVQEVIKRKRTRGIQQIVDKNNSEMNSDEDDLFNFAAKKVHLEDKRTSPVRRVTRQQRKSTSSPLDESASTSVAAAAKETPKSCNKQLPIAINKRSTRRTIINMSGFLEKSQVPNLNLQKTVAETHDIPTDKDKSKHGTKRPRIAVLDNSDDDDLFCFGGKSNTKEESNLAKRARADDNVDDSEEDLFNFGGDKSEGLNNRKEVIDVDLNKQSQAQKNNLKSIVMPKPKPLPAKICTANWLGSSLSALSIKPDQMKDEVDAGIRENNDSGVEGDSKENVELCKGGCVVTTLDVRTQNRESEWSRNTTISRKEDSNVNSTTKNYKKFVKKFRPQNHKVIATISSTVCGKFV